MKHLLLCLFCAAFTLGAENYYKLPDVKLIHDGWSFHYQPLLKGVTPSRKYVATTESIRRDIAMMEKSMPGSGIVIRFFSDKKCSGGKSYNVGAVFGGDKLKYEYFKKDIENLRNTKFKKFTDNFLGLSVSPGNVDWFDDKAWAVVCNNHKVISRVARESKMVGLKLDIEEYGQNTMWRFKPQNGRSLEETVKKVRQRGQEFGKAIFGEFPNIHLLCYWWLSLARTKNDTFHMDRAEYMVAPFVNGMYDVMPEGVTIHEGNESCAYRSNNETEFNHLSIDLRKNFLRCLDPKHLRKYRAQTMLAPGLYLDPHFSGKANFWSNQLKPDLKKLGGAKLLKRNIVQAAEVADRYVWLWHERIGWYPSHHPAKVQDVNKIAPKLTEDIDLLLKPMPRAVQLVKERKLRNLVRNGDFSTPGKGKQALAFFSEWYSKKQGKFFHKNVKGNGVAAASGVISSCIMQNFKAKSGEMYLVRCKGGNLGKNTTAVAKITVSWKMPGGERFADYLNRGYVFRRGLNKLEQTEFTVVVPEGAETLELMLSAGNCQKGDEIQFDDLELYKLVD